MASNSHLIYGKALHRVTFKKGVEDAVLKDLEELAVIFQEKRFKELLHLASGMEKVKLDTVIVNTFEKKVEEITLNLLRTLAGARKLALLPKIYDAYRRLYFAAKGIQEIVLASAHKLNKEQENELVEKLQSKKGKAISVRFKENPDLIGGIQIYEQGYLTDYSVKNYLAELKKKLLHI